MTCAGTMRAVRSDMLGPPEAYGLVEMPIPEPGPDEVRVRVAAASLGYADALLASGGYQAKPPMPHVPGTEVAGIIDAIGAAVTTRSVGERVTATGFGGALAEYMRVPAASTHRLSNRLGFAAGACFRTNFQTALYALDGRGRLQTGETLLVLGAAGGVGVAAVQLGRLLGARVIAGASNAGKRQYALHHGADAAIDYSRPDWRAALRAEVGKRGVDLVFDPVGGALFEPAFRSLAWGGRHLVVGFTGGPIPQLPINLALLKGAALVGVNIRQFALDEPDAYAAVGRRLDTLVEEGRLTPPSGPRLPLERFREALSLAGAGTSLGKIVVEMPGFTAA